MVRMLTGLGLLDGEPETGWSAAGMPSATRVSARLREELDGLAVRLEERCYFGKASQVTWLSRSLPVLAADPEGGKLRRDIGVEVGLIGRESTTSESRPPPPPSLSSCFFGIWRYLCAAESDLGGHPQQRLSASAAAARLARLGPPRGFDWGLQMYAMQQGITATMSSRRGQAAASIFSTYSLSDLRKETPFTARFHKELRAAHSPGNSDQARQLGNREFKAKRLWQAEAAYQLASELDPSSPASLSNLAHTRTLLGRQLRSKHCGNAQAALELLEQALQDARGSVARDPAWLRGYVRAAEAAEALGGEHLPAQLEALSSALRACEQRLAEAGGSDSSLAKTQAELQSGIAGATASVCMWESVAEARAGGDINRGLLAATERLKTLVATEVNPEDGPQLGDEAIAIVKQIQMLLRLSYQNPLKYPPIDDKSRLVDLGIDLRLCAKVLSMKALESEALREELFDSTLWGLHHLDRLGVAKLARDAPEPEMAEPETDQDKSFTELMKRASGAHMTIEQLHSTMEMVKGRMETSKHTDEAQTYTHYFHLTLLIRLVRSSLPLKRAAAERVIEYWRTEQGRHVAGELGSRALLAGCGLPKWELRADPEQQRFCFTVKGAVAALALDVVMGGETEGHTIQRFLAGVTPEQWRQLSRRDMYGVVWDYALCGLDKNVLHHETVQAPLVAQILANILESEPGMVSMLMGDYSSLEGSFLFPLMEGSAFGQYLIRSFYKRAERKARADGSLDLSATVLSLTSRWGKLSEVERSGYRWETFDKEERERCMADDRVKPPGPAHEAAAPASAPSPDGGAEDMFKVPLEVPRCRLCGEEAGPGVRLRTCARCGLVRYCCAEHQRADWKSHKPQCKAAAPS